LLLSSALSLGAHSIFGTDLDETIPSQQPYSWSILIDFLDGLALDLPTIAVPDLSGSTIKWTGAISSNSPANRLSATSKAIIKQKLLGSGSYFILRLMHSSNKKRQLLILGECN
jgi:hypothetical protein